MGDAAVSTVGRKPVLTSAQSAEVRRLADLRRQLTVKRMAVRYGVSEYVISQAARGIEMMHHIDESPSFNNMQKRRVLEKARQDNQAVTESQGREDGDR